MTAQSPQEFKAVIDRFAAISSDKRLVALYEFVRDIPYGNIGSRSAKDVLLQNKGTCSGKHALLKFLLEQLGFEVQSWFAKHNFGKFPIDPWPLELSRFRNQTIPDYHDFLKVHVENSWVTIDAVFDAPLQKMGFPLLLWDGKTDMHLPVDASEIFQSESNMEEHKKKLLAALPESDQKKRREFLSAMTHWLDAHRE